LFPEDPLKTNATAMGSLIHQVDRNAGRVAIRTANREGRGDEPPDAVDAMTEIWRAEVEPRDCRACDQ
jgi:hypothetical protein